LNTEIDNEVDEMSAFRAWCRRAGNYHAVETIDRWHKMSPRQRAEILLMLRRDGRIEKHGTGAHS